MNLNELQFVEHRADLNTHGKKVFIYGLDDNGDAVLIRVNSDGELLSADLSEYKIADSETGATSYFGYLRKDGAWYIQKSVITGAETAYTYKRGASGYSWADRADPTYAAFNVTF